MGWSMPIMVGLTVNSKQELAMNEQTKSQILTQYTVENFIEPLCEATSQTLKPISLAPTDFLVVSLDDEAKKFTLEALALRTVREDESPAYTLDHSNGSKLCVDWKCASTTAIGQTNSPWIKRIPTATENGAGRWVCEATDFSVVVIHHVWSKDRIIFKDEEAKLVYSYLLRRFFAQNRSAKIVAEFKINKDYPDLPDYYQEHPDLQPTPEQKVGIAASLFQESYALHMEQGTGKTCVAVNRVNLESLAKAKGLIPGVKPGMYRHLVVCPKNVRLNWEREFARFSTMPGKTCVLRGGLLDRQKHLIDGIRREADCMWSTCIVSTDSVESMKDFLAKVPWDLITWDESHYGKNPRAHRSVAMRDLSHSSRQRMNLTGTPIANTVMDLWSQLEFLGEGQSGFLTFSNFRSFHGKFKEIPAGATSIQKLVGVKAIPLLQERLSRIAFALTKKEANLNLPDKLYDIAEVEMTPKQAKAYNDLAESLVIKIEGLLEDDSKVLTVNHILVMLLRLAQITSGHIRFDDCDSVEQLDTTNPKVEYILDGLLSDERDPNGKTIIWATFVEDIRILSQALHDAGIKHVGYHRVVLPEYRQRDGREAGEVFNKDPECMVFLGNPASAGEGLNLMGFDPENPDDYKTQCDWEIYMSCNWSSVQRAQSEDRAHRRGTRCPVQITDLVVPGTIDEEIRARVLQKRQTAMMIQDVRELLRSILHSDLSVEGIE